MKWIKASERLPGKDKVVCMRGDGGGCYHYEAADRDMILQRIKDDLTVHHQYSPKWLDESPLSPSNDEDELLKGISEILYKDESVFSDIKNLLSNFHITRKQ